MIHKLLTRFFKSIFTNPSQTLTKETKEKLKQLYLEEEFNAEKRINRIYMFITVVIGGGIILLHIIINGFHIRELANIIGLLFFSTYLTIIYFLLKKNIYKPFFKYITMTIAITSITIIVVGYSFDAGWDHTLKTTTLLFYFVNIIFSGYYQNPKIAIYTGIIAAIDYTILFLYAVIFTNTNVVSIENFKFPNISFDMLLMFFSLLLLSGFFVSILSKRLRYLMARSLNSEAEAFQLGKKNAEVEKINTLQTNYFVNLAHETKTPLTLINNYLGKYINKKGIDEDLSIIKNNLSKLTKDILNFLDFEKFKQGKIIYTHNKIIDFSKILNDAVTLFHDNALNKNISIKRDIKEYIYIKIDPFALDRIINNLIDNAIKYTEPGGQVLLSLKIQDNNIIFKIKDTGIGIADEQQKNIFTPYYQISHKKQNSQGVGMGLAIVKNIINSIDGKININSKINEGTTFTLTLKNHILKAGEIAENSIQHSLIPVNTTFQEKVKTIIPNENRQNILIIEDNPDLVKLLVDSLSENYNSYYAYNGKEALNKLNNIPTPDLIISDIMMDRMDGIEFYKNIQNIDNYNDIPFIYLTAKNRINDELEILKMGAVDFITKPFSIDMLKYKIDAILKNRNNNIDKLKNSLLDVLYSKNTPKNQKDIQKFKFEDKCLEYKISKKEKEVIQLVFEGLEHKEIADNLNVSVTTIKTHIKNIYRKTTAQNKIELMNRFNFS